MASNELTMDATRLMRRVELRVRLTRMRQVSWRFWLGTKLMLLAAWVLPCGVEIFGSVEDK